MRQFKDPIAQLIYQRAYKYLHDEVKFPDHDQLADIMAQWIVQPLSEEELDFGRYLRPSNSQKSRFQCQTTQTHQSG